MRAPRCPAGRSTALPWADWRGTRRAACGSPPTEDRRARIVQAQTDQVLVVLARNWSRFKS